MDYTQTLQSELLAITTVSASTQTKSSEFTPGGKLLASFGIDIGPEATNTPGTEIRLEAAFHDSDNDKWLPVPGYTFITSRSTVNSNAVDGTENAGQTTIEETTTTGLALGQYVFFKNGTLANSEWAKVTAISSSTSFTILDALKNSQTSSTWYNQADRFIWTVECVFGKRYRVVINNNYGASAVAVNARVCLLTTDAIE